MGRYALYAEGSCPICTASPLRFSTPRGRVRHRPTSLAMPCTLDSSPRFDRDLECSQGEQTSWAGTRGCACAVCGVRHSVPVWRTPFPPSPLPSPTSTHADDALQRRQGGHPRTSSELLNSSSPLSFPFLTMLPDCSFRMTATAPPSPSANTYRKPPPHGCQDSLCLPIAHTHRPSPVAHRNWPALRQGEHFECRQFVVQIHLRVVQAAGYRISDIFICMPIRASEAN
jgi:hypothetical protein